ncbi:hypothetical protein I4U23_019774 [Adineta vaga]|nr:hypothetical protein I4U23_019774 [Adineta vaga]
MSTERALKTSFTSVGILLIIQGLLLLLFPHLATKLLFVLPLQTAQAAQYVRSTGLGVAIIGYYYYIAGKYGLIDFFRASIIGRLFALPVIVAMVYFYSIEIQLIIFGLQDLVTAFWSYRCLQAYDNEQGKIKN